MSSKKCRRLIPLALCGFSLLASSCVQYNRPYWSGDPAFPEKSIHKFKDGKINRQTSDSEVVVVEFDDQGDFWDRGQLDLVVKRIQKSKKPPLVVTYVHGWHNNAQPKPKKPKDLEGFQALIASLKLQYPKRDVTGVYLGWRGESTAIPVLNIFTFWNRKEGAVRVADGSITAVIQRVGMETRKKNGRHILVGHSFGGRIVEKSVSGNVVSQGATLEKDMNRPNLPADLILLINPATESLGSAQLQLSLERSPSQPPVIVAMGATNDQATKWAWNAGAMAKTFLGFGFYAEPDRKYVLPAGKVHHEGGAKFNQRKEFIYSTTTNHSGLFTHTMLYDEVRDVPNRRYLGTTNYYLTTEVVNTKPFRIPQPKHPPHHYGYWIFPVPTSLLNGHSNTTNGGIFSEPMIRVVDGLTQAAQMMEKPVQAPTPILPEPTEPPKSLPAMLMEGVMFMKSDTSS